MIFLFLLASLPLDNAKPLVTQNEFCERGSYCDEVFMPTLLSDKSTKPSQKLLCEACNVLMPIARALVKTNKTQNFEKIAIYICTEFKIVDPAVCSTVIPQFELSVLSVIRDSPLNDTELCNIGLDCGIVTNPILNWNISLPNVPKPPVQPPQLPSQDSPTLRILHISDLHIDFEYQPGAIADCLDPLCCRNQSTPSGRNSSVAGYWGDYRNCDVPLWTVENMFVNIANNEQFDFIYWTGDLPPHNVWNQTKNDQLTALNYLSGLFLKYFPNKIIYPTLGNHEAAPVNLYPPPFVKEDSIDWLYSAISTNWTATGLPASLKPDIQKGGFYTLQLYTGLRLVSLNMNYCPSGNFWLFINATDPLGQLEWLANVLQESEYIGEKVHIIGHIEPGGCLDSWTHNYFRIINRYESTVVGQFFGHSHSDQFRVYYDLDDLKRPTSVAYIGGSVTTYSYLNPAYRIYTIDGFYSNSSFQVLNHETKYMNLTEANLSMMSPQWIHEYTAKEDFNLPSVYAKDWDNLLNEILNNLNSPLFDKLYKFYYKSSDAIDYNNCDTNCRKNFICGFKHAPC